jgi:hypothetical protein
MGYDMYLHTRDPDAEKRTEDARAAFYAACKERDALVPDGAGWGTPERQAAMVTDEYKERQAKVETLSAEMDAANTNYFRLNNAGMRAMCESMDQLGMLVTEYDGNPHGAWPTHQEFGLTRDEFDALCDMERDEQRAHPDARFREFAERGDFIRSWSPLESGIPVHKFGSNDGWIVTPLDIAAGLRAYRAADSDDVAKVRQEWIWEGRTTSYFDEWIAFLERAQAGTGFEVF